MQTPRGSMTWKRNHQTSKKRQSPREERNPLFCLEKPPGALLHRAGLRRVCDALLTPALQSVLLGRGMPCCSELARSQVHVEAFQATQLLTALQLLYHAVLLYITLLSLPGGTAVLQYGRLSKCKTDFFTSQIPTDCCHCSHYETPCSVLDSPAFLHMQGILASPAQLAAAALPAVLPKHPQLPAQGVTTT